MNKTEFLARLESLAQAYARLLGFDLRKRDGHQIECAYRAGYLQGARDAFDISKGVVIPFVGTEPIVELLSENQAELLGGEK